MRVHGTATTINSVICTHNRAYHLDIGSIESIFTKEYEKHYDVRITIHHLNRSICPYLISGVQTHTLADIYVYLPVTILTISKSSTGHRVLITIIEILIPR